MMHAQGETVFQSLVWTLIGVITYNLVDNFAPNNRISSLLRNIAATYPGETWGEEPKFGKVFCRADDQTVFHVLLYSI
jgi:hypothetical protein